MKQYEILKTRFKKKAKKILFINIYNDNKKAIF